MPEALCRAPRHFTDRLDMLSASGLRPAKMRIGDGRFVLAWLAASFVNVVAVWFVFLVAAWTAEAVLAEVAASAMHLVFFFLFLGYPIALVVTGVVAVPATQHLNRRGMQALRRIVTCICALAVVIVAGLWWLIDGGFRPLNIVALLISGLFLGLSGTLTYWLIMRPWSGSPAADPRD
jgi:hypothetical protein